LKIFKKLGRYKLLLCGIPFSRQRVSSLWDMIARSLIDRCHCFKEPVYCTAWCNIQDDDNITVKLLS